jgi:transcriptional regulator with XRE-family HTH domain
MKFAHRKIKGLRRERHYSLAMTCRLLETRCNLKVSRTSLNHWENGRAMPTIVSLMAVCELYEVEPGYFFEAASKQTVCMRKR